MADQSALTIDLARRRSLIDSIPDTDPDLRGEISYFERILDAYSDMRWSTRSLIDSAPSEARLLFFALLSDVIFFLARSLSMVVAPPDGVRDALPDQIGLGLVVAFLMRTALFYVIAAAATAIAAPFGGRGGWHGSRCAVFWAALVSAPVEFAAALISIGVSYLGGDAGASSLSWLVEAPYFIGPIAFGFFVSAGLAEAHGFRYTYKVMAVVALVSVATVWAILSIGAMTAG